MLHCSLTAKRVHSLTNSTHTHPATSLALSLSKRKQHQLPRRLDLIHPAE
jgi:hypothetical protein